MTDSLIDIEDARKRSVTKQDIIPASQGGAFTVLMGPIGLLSAVPGLAQHGQFALPPIGTIARDQLLAMTPYFETMWSAVIFKLISKKIAQGFRIEDADDSRGTGGDEGADSDCEIITCCVRQEHFQIGPLGLVNISKANAGVE